MPKGQPKGPVTQHHQLATTGKISGDGSDGRGGKFAAGGFVSTNDKAHKHSGAPLHFGKTKKMKCNGP